LKIKLNYVFKTLDGMPLKNQGKDFTFKAACENALLIEQADPRTGQPKKSIDGTEKMRRYSLALQIHNAKSEVDISIEDVKLLKDLIAEIGSPLIVGQAWNILDPRDPKETIPKDK